MNSITKLFLDETYEIDGVIMTGKEIMESKIDSVLYRKNLKELRGDAE